MKVVKFAFEAIGTHWKIDILKELSKEEEALLLNKIMERIDEFDKAYSRFRRDSLVMRMAEKADKYKLPEDADKMISLYRKMYDATGGLVTPLIGQVLVDAGYDDTYSLVPKEMKNPLPWDEVMSWEDGVLTLKKPEILDFGAGGKGYLVDLIGELLEANRVHSYCVDAGGDMRSRLPKVAPSLKVGLEHPEDPESVIGVISISDQSLCGSAGNRRVWADFHHVINPETLKSPREILAVWVLADSTLLADLLTTGLFFTSPEILSKDFEFEYLILRPDYSVEKSENFNAELFT